MARKGRPIISDVAAVRILEGGEYKYVVSRSYAETADLISEGPIEGITSGHYTYTKNPNNLTGYQQVVFEPYTATGVVGGNVTDLESLGFLRSVYWNEVPVVDKDGYYNFASVNLNYVPGAPIGNIPTLNAELPGYGSLSSDKSLDLTVSRSIGERLYGPEVKGGEDTPTSTKHATLKGPVDKYAKTYTILNKECFEIQVNIKVTSLFENIQAGPKTYKRSRYLKACAKASTGYGDTKARTVQYSVFYQPIFDDKFSNRTTTSTKADYVPSTWKLGKKETVTGKIDEPYVRTTTIDVSTAGFMDKEGFEGWRVRIVRNTPESLTSFLRNTTFVDSIVEVYGTKLRYPYSSMVYSQFDARSFARIPSRAYDTHLLKVNVPNNYNPMLKSYGKSSSTGDEKTNCSITKNTNGTITKYLRDDANPETEWDGNFADEKQWTDNPAWCFYDLVTNPRYGLGEFIDTSQVDKWSLYEIAQYCDELVDDTYGGFEPRFTINYTITSREEAFKVLNDLSSIFRGIAYYTNGSIFAAQDKYKLPVYQFTNSNVVDGNFTYSSSSKKARHTVAIVRYNDRKNFYQPTIEYVEDEESVRRYGIREIETTALGCVSRGQARRFAKWILASESEETETVSFSAGLEGSYLRPGDVVQVYDNNRSPLKHSGRTNAVRPLAAGAYSTVKGSPTVNSVVLDQALDFTDNKIYKFSLLTPTYDYNPSGITTSDNISGIRRSHVQTLVFDGADTRTITGEAGTFRSDFLISGSGVCTEIYFNSGMYAFSSGNKVPGDIVVPYTGNQFNFVDYVITGYDNNRVQVAGTEDDPTTISEPYSGGYFSGENLIWSVEPNDPNDIEFISGSYSNFKVINIREEVNNTHSVAALAYSTGKYDNVDTVNSSVSSQDIDSVYFPLPNVYNYTFGTSDMEDWATNYPRQTYTPDDANIDETNTNLFDVEEDHPYMGEEDNKKILTLLANFATAGYVANNNTTDILLSNQSDKATLRNAKEAQKTISYSLSIIIGANPEITKNWANGNAITPKVGVTYIVDAEHYSTISDNEVVLITNLDTKYFAKSKEGEIDYTRIKFETLVNEKDDHYFVVYPITDQGIVSHGYLRKFSGDDISAEEIFSPLQGVSIHSLATEGIVSNEKNKNLVYIESEEPTFVWTSAPELPMYNDEGKDYQLSFDNNIINYRITIREAVRGNIPANNIYYEFTGYNSPTNSPSFVFDSTYNTPALITDLSSAPYTGEPVSQQNHLGYTRYENTGPNGETFYKVAASGMVIRDYPNYPLREFDIVVEAQGADGRTSVGNALHANTIGTATESWNQSVIDQHYDIMGIQIDAPSGIFFSHSHRSDLKGDPFNVTYVTESRAAGNNYPYRAEARVFPDGYFQLTVNQVDTANGEPTIDDEDFDKFFNNVAGMVYYYTTGDHSIAGEADGDSTQFVATNMAPSFTININETNDEDELLAEQAANIDKIKRDSSVGADGRAFGGIVQGLPANYGSDHQGGKGIIYRDYKVLEGAEDISTIRIPFPKIGRTDVSNIYFTMALFDNLSLQRAFDGDDATPILEEANGNKTPKIFSDTSLDFSTIPGWTAASSAPDTQNPGGGLGYYSSYNVRNGRFSKAPGTAAFLSESSILSAQNSSMGFQAWAEVVIGASFMEAQKLTLDTYGTYLSRPDKSNATWPHYSADGKSKIYEPSKGQSTGFIPLIVNSSSGEEGDPRIRPSFSKGIISLSDTKVFVVASSDYNTQRVKYLKNNGRNLNYASERVLMMEMNFLGKEIDADKYTVLCDICDPGRYTYGEVRGDYTDKNFINTTNLGKDGLGGYTATTNFDVRKRSDGFTVFIDQRAGWVRNIKGNGYATFLSPFRLWENGGMRIQIRVLADVG